MLLKFWVLGFWVLGFELDIWLLVHVNDGESDCDEEKKRGVWGGFLLLRVSILFAIM